MMFAPIVKKNFSNKRRTSQTVSVLCRPTNSVVNKTTLGTENGLSVEQIKIRGQGLSDLEIICRITNIFLKSDWCNQNLRVKIEI